MLNSVNLEAMALERASLREALFAEITLVRSYTRVGSRVSLQVKSIIESLAAECAQITFDVAVTLHMTIE